MDWPGRDTPVKLLTKLSEPIAFWRLEVREWLDAAVPLKAVVPPVGEVATDGVENAEKITRDDGFSSLGTTLQPAGQDSQGCGWIARSGRRSQQIENIRLHHAFFGGLDLDSLKEVSPCLGLARVSRGHLHSKASEDLVILLDQAAMKLGPERIKTDEHDSDTGFVWLTGTLEEAANPGERQGSCPPGLDLNELEELVAL